MVSKMRSLLAIVVLLTLAAPAVFGNAAPQPPLSREEVQNPQDWLSMRDENVDVVIEGDRARVKALFHFDIVTMPQGRIAQLRMGFPELATQAPLENFTVKRGVAPADMTPVYPWTAKINSSTVPVGSPFDAGLKTRRWLTWDLEVEPPFRGPRNLAANVEVTYTQKLRDNKFIYVLRSGKPWAGKIGKSVVTVRCNPSRLAGAYPKPTARYPQALAWTWTDWEPATDVSVRLK
jgi:hypothetical protein